MSISKPYCFVLMPFSHSFDSVWEALREAFDSPRLASRYQCLRADDLFNHGVIIDQIRGTIAMASFLIADLSEQNPNVFYELGLAHEQGKPVILLCQSIEDVPFDLRHLRVIVYDIEDWRGRGRLVDSLLRFIEGLEPSPVEVPALVALATHEDAAVRVGACTMLGRLRASAATGTIVACLADVHDAVREAAANALVALGEDGCRLLIQALRIEDHLGRAEAAQALRRSLSPLLESEAPWMLMDGNPDVRAIGASTAGEKGLSELLPQLIELTEDDDELVRVWAVMAVGLLGEEASIDTLILKLDDRCCRSMAGKMLQAYGELAVKPIAEASLRGDISPESAVEGLASLYHADVPIEQALEMDARIAELIEEKENSGTWY